MYPIWTLLHEGPDPNGFCWPKCIWFKCAKRALTFRSGTAWCSWTNDNCIGPSCSYALCIRSKLLPGNRCGLVVRRITVDKVKLKDFELNLKIPGKLAQRIGNKEEIV